MVIKGLLFDLDGTLVDSDAIRHLRDRRAWRECAAAFGTTSLYAGITELMAELEARVVPWAVVTRSPSNYAEGLLRYHGLKWTARVAYHDVPRGRHKPHPDCYLKAMPLLRLEADEVLGIGDDEPDAQSINAAGILSIGAGWNPNLTRNADWSEIAPTPAAILRRLRRT